MTPPDALMVAGYVAYMGSSAMTSSPGPASRSDATNRLFCVPPSTITLSAVTACPVRAACRAATAARSAGRPAVSV